MDKQSLREIASYGDTITVTYLKTQYTDGGITEEQVEKTDTGTVKAIPSKKFSRPTDYYLLDYELDRGSAVRSINFDSGAVSQLSYDAGGDRDWEQWDLVSVEVNGRELF